MTFSINVVKGTELTKEQRVQFNKEHYVDCTIPKHDDYYGAEIIRYSSDDLTEARECIKHYSPLLRGNSVTLTQILPESIFHRNGGMFISNETQPVYYVQVFLANTSCEVNNICTFDLVEAIDYCDKLEKFFHLNPWTPKVS